MRPRADVEGGRDARQVWQTADSKPGEGVPGILVGQPGEEDLAFSGLTGVRGAEGLSDCAERADAVREVELAGGAQAAGVANDVKGVRAALAIGELLECCGI